MLAGICNCFGLQREATFFVIYWETWSCRICDLATETLYGLLVFRVLLFSVGQRVELLCEYILDEVLIKASASESITRGFVCYVLN